MTDRETHIRTCPLCEATCGLELTLNEDRSVKVIRGDRADVFSKGFVCPKGTTLHRLHEDPDRLRKPLVRTGERGEDSFEEVEWADAFSLVAERLGTHLGQDRNSVAVYLGNPNAHGHHNVIYGRPFIKALGTRNVFSASTVDQMPKHVSSGLMFGSPLAIPVPDLDRTDHLLILGANPLESNGSLCTAPDFPGRLQAILDRGGKVVVVDPRRTKTARAASEHVFIRPGTDAMLLLALARLVVQRGPRTEAIQQYTEGLDGVAAAVDPFTVDRVAAVTRIDSEVIVRMAEELMAAPTSVVYSRIGTHTTQFGTLAAWATDLLNVLTGNLDRPGGAMWPAPAHTPRRPSPGGRGYTVGRWHSRVGSHAEANGELPVAAMAEEILTPGEGQVRALVTIGGNPVLSIPDAANLAEALDDLDFMVSIDPSLNETTRHADVILPPPSQLERSHFDLAFYALSVRNIANWSPPLYDSESPDEVEILARLAMAAMGMDPNSDPAPAHDLVLDTLIGQAVAREGSLAHGLDPADVRAALWATHPADRALEVMLRSGRYGDGFGTVPGGLTLEKLADEPHGIDLGALEPQLPDMLSTASGRVELLPEVILADLPRLVEAMSADRPETVLVGRRDLRSNNSWMHNVEVLVKGRERCVVWMNPADAERHGISDGQQVRMTSRVGTVTAPVTITADIAPGVVSLPHGWGHDLPGTRMSVAAGRPGVNTNLLTDAAQLDPLSGNATLNGIPVTLERA
ncbi:MAG: molybdopterin-dependent oxidoreductase [Microthrixaceae bacterium]|nr:molybdopterin-dependent oxidoreductase [Microthrixaceae bacterium]MCO5319874.1 molybdopterin-dependent oxidoreductase [Microthrixaceae bacterium]